MIDLHCHLLPGIDDGPDTMEESIELCAIASADGITHSIVTPHIHPGRWENSYQLVEHLRDELQSSIREQNIPLQLGFAGEVRLTDQIIQQVERGEIPFYGSVDGYNIMLLEFPHAHIIPGSDKLVSWLMSRGIRPLIAHPERNKQVMNDFTPIYSFVEAGCWLQLTAGSITGGFGARAQEAALRMLMENLVAVVASDGHNRKARKPIMQEASSAIASQFGDAKATELTLLNPALIADSQFNLSLPG
ncbi:MAG: protein-tyrosine phosphatase [Halioglobus sp.]|jgi:protein-tyrosine phosphatase